MVHDAQIYLSCMNMEYRIVSQVCKWYPGPLPMQLWYTQYFFKWRNAITRAWSHVGITQTGLLPLLVHDAQGFFPCRYMINIASHVSINTHDRFLCRYVISRISSHTVHCIQVGMYVGTVFAGLLPMWVHDVQDFFICACLISSTAPLMMHDIQNGFPCRYMICKKFPMKYMILWTSSHVSIWHAGLLAVQVLDI